MTATSIPFDDVWLIDNEGFRDMEVAGEMQIEYVDHNRWSIVGVKLKSWTKTQPYTIGLTDPEPPLDCMIRHKIMTNQGWCEHISQTIASEIAQANRQPSRHAELMME